MDRLNLLGGQSNLLGGQMPTQLACYLLPVGDVPPEKLGNFVFLKLESCNLVNTFRRKFRTGDEKNTN